MSTTPVLAQSKSTTTSTTPATPASGTANAKETSPPRSRDQVWSTRDANPNPGAVIIGSGGAINNSAQVAPGIVVVPQVNSPGQTQLRPLNKPSPQPTLPPGVVDLRERP